MEYFSVIIRRASKFLLLIVCAITLPVLAGECKGTVYLTFDTGNMEYADFIARTIREKKTRATFFLANTPTRRGDHALDESWKDYWISLTKEGHAFGNHTWSHYYAKKDVPGKRVRVKNRTGNLIELDKKQYCQQLQKVERQFQKLTNQKLQSMWRAPGGKTTGQTLRWANDCGYPVHVGWDPAGYIGDDRPVVQADNKKLLTNAISSIKGGDIILMHLGIWNRKTPLAPILPQLIDSLKARGLCFDVLSVGKR